MIHFGISQSQPVTAFFGNCLMLMKLVSEDPCYSPCALNSADIARDQSYCKHRIRGEFNIL